MAHIHTKQISSHNSPSGSGSVSWETSNDMTQFFELVLVVI